MNHKQIILFDGVCNFCNFWVNFVLKHDHKNLFLFAPLQSKAGQQFLTKFNLPTTDFDTFILINGDSFQTKSDAAISIASNIAGWPKVLVMGYIIPRFLRNFIYDLIAKNRYKIFGKRESCRVPTKEEKEKFLD
ncbi:MAG: thiol-disulfide oxidoreductase DCC family protein [Ignavibacterium sp.]|uniref:thiol-disulfide oxidoreductase DCC family protein n=1 Tax=Ignavibacterium sp. TaxID=2651167 RepID=UPI004049B9FB